MKTILIALVILASTVNLEAKTPKLVDNFTHHHRKLAKIAGRMMTIDFNIDVGKGKKKR